DQRSPMGERPPSLYHLTGRTHLPEHRRSTYGRCGTAREPPGSALTRSALTRAARPDPGHRLAARSDPARRLAAGARRAVAGPAPPTHPSSAASCCPSGDPDPRPKRSPNGDHVTIPGDTMTEPAAPVAMTVRLPADLAGDLGLVAEADGQTVADAIRSAVAQWI